MSVLAKLSCGERWPKRGAAAASGPTGGWPAAAPLAGDSRRSPAGFGGVEEAVSAWQARHQRMLLIAWPASREAGGRAHCAGRLQVRQHDHHLVDLGLRCSLITSLTNSATRGS
jgi:hypothetical protein